MADTDSKEQPVVEKPRKKRLLGVLVTSVLIVGAGVAGTVLGPRLLANRSEDGDADVRDEGHESDGPESEDKPPNPMAFQPLIVDVRDKKSLPHHMKVGLTVELKDGVKKEEFDKLQPRGREAAISFLRGRTFEELTEPDQFDAVSKELNERIIKAMGEKLTLRVIITDFVAQ
ncbi:MAG TPA: flagellar basal body-associated FliL family protein [Polyangiaceae bacterium]